MGSLTTHILDITQGRPAAEVIVAVYRFAGKERHLVKQTKTNQEGRCETPLLTPAEFTLGTFELVFYIGDYFRSSAAVLNAPVFLDEVPVRFGLADDQHHHIPLLISPWSYSLYRGS